MSHPPPAGLTWPCPGFVDVGVHPHPSVPRGWMCCREASPTSLVMHCPEQGRLDTPPRGLASTQPVLSPLPSPEHSCPADPGGHPCPSLGDMWSFRAETVSANSVGRARDVPGSVALAPASPHPGPGPWRVRTPQTEGETLGRPGGAGRGASKSLAPGVECRGSVVGTGSDCEASVTFLVVSEEQQGSVKKIPPSPALQVRSAPEPMGLAGLWCWQGLSPGS